MNHYEEQRAKKEFFEQEKRKKEFFDGLRKEKAEKAEQRYQTELSRPPINMEDMTATEREDQQKRFLNRLSGINEDNYLFNIPRRETPLSQTEMELKKVKEQESALSKAFDKLLNSPEKE